MRRQLSSLLVVAMIIVCAGTAGAYELRLVVPDSMSVSGPTALFDVYLDTQGQKNISFFSVSLSYDASFLTYNPALSGINDYYPLYAPAVMGTKATPSFPATWLTPGFPVEPFDWVGNGGGGTPAGLTGQINVDFIVNTGAIGQAQGTATNLWLATLAFDRTGDGGYGPLLFGFEGGGNVFSINGDSTTVVPNTVIEFVPEPGTALLVGLGLFGLAMARRGDR